MSRYQLHLIGFSENTFDTREIDCATDSEAIAKALRLDFPRYEARFEIWQEERFIYRGRCRHAPVSVR